MKSKKSTIMNALCIIFLISLVIKTFIPVSLKTITENFNFNTVTTCTATYDEKVVVDGEVKNYIYVFSFHTSSKEYENLVELLNSTKYRKKLINTGNANGYTVTLSPYASIAFYSEDKDIDFLFYGKSFAVGEHMNKTDCKPTGGIEFQEEVIKFIYENGTLISKEEF